jgi:hypothetical protein
MGRCVMGYRCSRLQSQKQGRLELALAFSFGQADVNLAPFDLGWICPKVHDDGSPLGFTGGDVKTPLMPRTLHDFP